MIVFGKLIIDVVLNHSLLKIRGCVSGVASSSSFQIFIVLSHSAVIILRELRSNLISNIPASQEREPG